ncbi:MAG: AAA family ATPase, partial [candidate division WOR-3 bacterium]
MRIQELVLIGFKSFQEKTVLRFSPGINAIVGPNGCGKTNILDALRWVLGEQSFALLRCGRNEDLIFNGTATVPPTNYAEVRLVLATDDPASRVAEIELCRRYFRSGESEYYLNRQPCRLKDIQDVFLSSGTGTRAYSIFDLRQMREIISGNIRRMFEEAATLAKYQDAKDECQRKLALTEADLVRLDDIIAERERLVRSLARQAARLRAYNRLRAEENELQLIALKEEYDALVREKARVQTDVDALEQAGSARLDEINRLEETLKIQRAKLRDLQTARDQAQTLVQEQRRVVTELESKTLLARQQIDFLSQAAARSRRERETLLQNLVQLEQAFNQTLAQLAQANEQMAREQQTLETERTTTQAEEEKLYRLKTHDAALQHQLKELLEQQAALKGELARLQALKDNETEEQARLAEELTSLEAKMTQVQAELEQLDLTRAALQQDLIAHSRRSETLRTELAGLNQRLKEIQKTHDDLDRERVRREKDLAVLRYRAGTEQTEACRTILGDTLLGSVSQLLNIRPGWERAFEAALHHVADFLVTTLGPGSEQLTSLAQTRPDLCFGFLTLHSTPSPSAPPLPEDDAILAPLIQYVEFDPLTPASLQTMIRRTLVVASVRELQRLGPAHPDWSFVTQDGWCRAHDGRLVLAASASGKLGAARLAQEHTQNLAEIETEQTKLSTEQARLLRRRSELENDLSERELQNADLQRQAHTHDALRNALAAQLDELQRDRDRLHTRQNRTSTAPASLTETQTRLAQTSARV